uniref:Uncharacterized protein n=1 Tax=Timema poppense TaxID=170557 RepID=A0A7R9CID6_TIMPO|nr:unnamed protein product [Timema poppensis]
MTSPSSGSPKWKLPEDVMKLHKFKLKKRALQERMNKPIPSTGAKSQGASSDCVSFNSNESKKRRNPFKAQSDASKKPQFDQDTIHNIPVGLNISSEDTLFHMLNNPDIHSNFDSSRTSFEGIFNKSANINKNAMQDDHKKKSGRWIPIDWTLKTKLRFMSVKPFPWNEKLKTSEEASGITGFVRCLNTGISPNQNINSLDTSPNAQFHQCCLVWQYPVLPWLNLFPRMKASSAANASNFIATDSKIKDTLYEDWGKSFLSLFQLVRVCQCPYFYVSANTFTCLFRAAGICGHSDIHALLTPTTRGFRHLLKVDDVVFTMPLKSKTFHSSENTKSIGSESLSNDNINESIETIEEIGADEEVEDDLWLESMGVSTDEIWRLNSTQAKLVHQREKKVDQTRESLIYVEGVEVQALFNFLMNCKSSVATSGFLAGIPPTLLAPVAFHGATLKPLKVRQSTVIVNNSSFHSTEILGPILPHTIHNMCALLSQSVCEFSATFANVESTCAFSLAEKELKETNGGGENKSKVPAAFGKEKLSDCGIEQSVLERFCSSDDASVQVMDTIKFTLDNMFIWS